MGTSLICVACRRDLVFTAAEWAVLAQWAPTTPGPEMGLLACPSCRSHAFFVMLSLAEENPDAPTSNPATP